MQPEQQQRILGYFLEEARDHLNTIEQGLLNLQGTLNDPEMINEVFRAAHSIKGGAAMLGLNSIQHTSHRLEDCFKLLKEHPVQIDQKLESLFLAVADTLKALLDHLGSPFGLSEDTVNTLMSETEPVFQWLNQHLELLLQQGGNGYLSDAATQEPMSGLAYVEAPRHTLSGSSQQPIISGQNQNWTEFQTQVLQTLREMLQLFKQSATTLSRQNLQQCCQKLDQLGKQYNLSNWSKLCQASAVAITNPQNTYLTLAKIIITEIKQAQELAVQGRETEITINQELQALLSPIQPTIADSRPDLLNKQPDPVNLPPQQNTGAAVKEVLNRKPSVIANRDALQFSGIPANKDLASLNHQSLFMREDLSSTSNIDHHGPEVGIAELNTLADLFEGESSELDEPWQKAEILDAATYDVGSSNFTGEGTDEDLADLLSLDNIQIQEQDPITFDATADLNLLFGDPFSEQDNLALQKQLSTSENRENIAANKTSNSDEELDLTIIFDADESDNYLAELTLTPIIDPQQSELASIETTDSEDNDIAELLALTLDTKDNPLLIRELNQQEVETLTINNLEDLYPEQAVQDLILTPISEDSTYDLDTDDIFADLRPTMLSEESSQTELDNFWDQANTLPSQAEELFTQQDIEHDIAAALEENLLAVDDNTGLVDTEQSTPATDINLEGFDFDFQQQPQNIDLILAADDSSDDLFADLTAAYNAEIPTDPKNNQEVLSQEKQSSDPGEILDFLADLSNESLEIPVVQTFIDFAGVDNEHELNELNELNELGLLDSFADGGAEDASLSSPDLVIEHSTYIQTDNLEPDLDLDLDLTADKLDESVEQIQTAPPIAEEHTTILQAFADLERDLDLVARSSFAAEILDSDILEAPADEEIFADFSNDNWIENLGDESLDEQSLGNENLGEIGLDETFEDLEAQLNHPDLIVLGEQNSTVEWGNIQPSIDTPAQELGINISATDLPESDQTQVPLAEDGFDELEALLDLDSPPIYPAALSKLDADFEALDALLDETSKEIPQVTPVEPTINPAVVPLALQSDEFSDPLYLSSETGQTTSSSPFGAARPSTASARGAAIDETMKVPVKQLDEMSNLVGELVVNRNTLEQDHERLRQSLDNLLLQVQHLSDVGARMQQLYERSLLEASLLASRKNRESQDSSRQVQDRGFSELEMDHFTLFHTLAQETIEYIVRIRESASDIDFVTEDTERVARQFRQVTTHLQEGLTKSRMNPFSQTVDRLRRGVRDNAMKYKKRVELVTEGQEILVDRMILDHLTDPLIHMVNNAISHGIETPEVREASGKSPVGKITIRAFHQGNQTVISVSDDGIGIDHNKVKNIAVQKGLITSEQAKDMSRQDAYELLFKQGFTTADHIDELQGRGIGMDVVNTRINEIRGTVITDSIIGKGTTFTIRLPLTLSICKALCCVSDKARIAFPMDGVEDTLNIPEKDIQHYPDGKFIQWRDTLLPFKPLKEILALNRQITRSNVYGANPDDDKISVLVVRSGNNMLALQVDQVLSEQEIVIKRLEGPAPKPDGIAGATVLGDGRIMPIADVLEIIDIFQGKKSKQIGGMTWQHKPAMPIHVDLSPVKVDPTVLIVDDSITVRELLSLTFNKAGYRVEQARDGQEAWDKLRSGLPCDIIFCDIEMPRCDGLALLSLIHKDANLSRLPIAMLTSRGADKHRQMAVQLGASGYFTKPYLEEALLEAAARMLKGEKLVTA